MFEPDSSESFLQLEDSNTSLLDSGDFDNEEDSCLLPSEDSRSLSFGETFERSSSTKLHPHRTFEVASDDLFSTEPRNIRQKDESEASTSSESECENESEAERDQLAVLDSVMTLYDLESVK
ncbi:unnamed protein product [Protopolystoma xenopodis]|uniref:Uncharacterized protein n=1 Tax=Protopolystoma xenopodis TaxID=117903 RepID=A0A3S5CQB8_9PLAT|nr:unnamed protein product [Protopolystoma xenopodis]